MTRKQQVVSKSIDMMVPHYFIALFVAIGNMINFKCWNTVLAAMDHQEAGYTLGIVGILSSFVIFTIAIWLIITTNQEYKKDRDLTQNNTTFENFKDSIGRTYMLMGFVLICMDIGVFANLIETVKLNETISVAKSFTSKEIKIGLYFTLGWCVLLLIVLNISIRSFVKSVYKPLNKSCYKMAIEPLHNKNIDLDYEFNIDPYLINKLEAYNAEDKLLTINKDVRPKHIVNETFYYLVAPKKFWRKWWKHKAVYEQINEIRQSGYKKETEYFPIIKEEVSNYISAFKKSLDPLSQQIVLLSEITTKMEELDRSDINPHSVLKTSINNIYNYKSYLNMNYRNCMDRLTKAENFKLRLDGYWYNNEENPDGSKQFFMIDYRKYIEDIYKVHDFVMELEGKYPVKDLEFVIKEYTRYENHKKFNLGLFDEKNQFFENLSKDDKKFIQKNFLQ